MASVTTNERNTLDMLPGAGKPPVQGGGLDSGTIGTLSKGQNSSRWSINIQEIVKRTQKNLERGSSSLNRNMEKRVGGTTRDDGDGEIQYLSKNVKLGFGSSSTKDKNSLLYNDLKKKLSYDTHPTVSGAGAEQIVPGTWRKDNLLSLTGQSSAKMMTRPTAGANNSSVGLQFGNQKSSLSDKFGIARIKRQSHDVGKLGYRDAEGINQQQYEQVLQPNATAGSIQGTQGGGELYHQDNFHQQHPYSQPRTIEERQMAHQRTLMQAGRLNQIGSEENNEPDEEAHLVRNGSHERRPHYEFRRHNSNLVRSSALSLEIQDQQELQRELNDSHTITEANMTEEQTQRHGNRSSVDQSQEQLEQDGGPMNANNLMTQNTLKLNQLRATGSTGNANQIQMFTETHVKRATVDLKGRHAGASTTQNYMERRQKIFEEEIIKRIKEIQRYVKSLHLQIKKTQAGQEKLKEEVESDKDVLISLQQTVGMTNKKYQTDKLKTVSGADLDSSLKEMESMANQRLIKVVTEATDQVLRQVRDEIVPDARLKMYDSITEETNRLKLDLNYQMQTLKREQSDETKKDRLRNSEVIRKEVSTLQDEILTEQSSQTLQILAQVDSQIAKALKEVRKNEVPRAELSQLKNELLDKMLTDNQRFKGEMQEEVAQMHDTNHLQTENRLKELHTRMKEMLDSKITSISQKFVAPEMLREQLQEMQHETSLALKNQAQKIVDQNKALFVSVDKFQSELSKVKRDFGNQVTKSQEEAKYDALQMIQSDMVEVTNIQKDFKFKVEELQASQHEIRTRSEETVQRLTNKEKESGALKKQTRQLQDQQVALDNKFSNLSAELTEFKTKQESASKAEKLDSYRSTGGAAATAAAMEEVELMRDELRELSDHCNQLERDISETRTQVSSGKSSSEKQYQQLKTQIDELQKQAIDGQFEAGRNKKFFEDQVTEVTRDAEGLQTRIINCEETQAQATEQRDKIVEELRQESEEKFEDIKDTMAGMMLEIQQINVMKTEPMRQTEQTEASANKDDQHLIQQQEILDELTEKVKDNSMKFSVLEARIQNLETEDSSKGQASEINSLQMMLATLSERNSVLEDKIKECQDSQKSMYSAQAVDLAQQQAYMQATATAESKKVKDWCQTGINTVNGKIKEQSECIQQLRREEQVDIEALKSQLTQSIERVKTDTEAKVETVANEIDKVHEMVEKLSQQPIMMKTKSQSGPTWQESSVKKLETKKATGWAEVRATKIESRGDMVQSMASSNKQCSSSSIPTSALKSVPPPRADEVVMASPDKKMKFDEEIQEEPVGLNGCEESKANQPAPDSILSMSVERIHQEDGDESNNQRLLDSEMRKVEDAINHSSLRKPTEYSASIDHQQQPTARPDHIGRSESEIEIKSPVQFEMVAESDVKVQETNSSRQSNLLLEYQMAYDDDNNLNDKIISPSEGIKVPNAADFYQLQREVHSSQVQKKNDMTIRVDCDQVVESEKVDSPKPLDANDFCVDEEITEEEQQLVQHQAPNQLQLPASEEEVSIVSQDDQVFDDQEESSLKIGQNGLVLQQPEEHATDADLGGLILDCGKGKLSESSQLFRTHKMSGLAMLSQKVNQLHLDGLEESQELESGLNQQHDASESKQQDSEADLHKLMMGSVADQSEEGMEGMEGIPTSSAILGMKLGEFGRKNSDGKSSMMGLSALGLESHRDSSQQDQQYLPELSEAAEEHRSETGLDDIDVLEQDKQIDQVIAMLVVNEIEQALNIMVELEHPNIVEKDDY